MKDRKDMQGRTDAPTGADVSRYDGRTDRYSTHASYANAAMVTHVYATPSEAASDMAECAFEALCDVVGYRAQYIDGTELIDVPHAVRYAVVQDADGVDPYIDMLDREDFTAKLSAYIMASMHADGIWVATIGKTYLRSIDHAMDGVRS